MKIPITKVFYYIVGFLILFILYSLIANLYFRHLYYRDLFYGPLPIFIKLLYFVYFALEVVLLVGGIGILDKKDWARKTLIIIIPAKFLIIMLTMVVFIIASIKHRDIYSFAHFIRGFILNILIPLFLIVSCFLLLFQPSIKALFQSSKSTGLTND